MHGFDAAREVGSVAARAGAAGAGFVGRYYSYHPGKTLTPGEARDLAAAGLRIVSVWEALGDRYASFSAAQGARDAAEALRLAALCGQPEGSGIYFAVDFDASIEEIASGIADYFRAVSAAFANRYRVGVYGSGLVCRVLSGNRLAELLWLASAARWRGSAGFAGWHIRQFSPAEADFRLGFAVDPDEAIDGDFGQWVPGGVPAPRTLSLMAPPMRGADVVTLQRALDKDCAPLDVDGVYGCETERVVKLFQRRAGLTPDGIVGPRTRAALGLE